METKLDVNEFKIPLGAWYQLLRPFFMSKYAQDLYDVLKRRGKAGQKILPFSHRTFTAFHMTDPITIKCILVGVSPYHTMGKNTYPSADGLLFSNSLSQEISPNLKMFYDGIDSSLNTKVERVYDLSYLAEQGVLLLNASLTTELGKPTIHNDMGLWDDFNDFFYGGVLEKFTNLPIVTIGKEAKKLEKHIFPMANPILNTEHPTYAARQHRDWDCNNMFNWINERVVERKGEFAKIYWDKKIYEEVKLDTKTPWD